MHRSSTKGFFSATLLALPLALTLAACGGDDDGGTLLDAGTDASVGDGGGSADAGPEANHSGLIALTDVVLTNPEFAVNEFSGSQISVSYSDDDTDTVLPVAGYDNAVGGCEIKVYNVGTDAVPTPTNEGPVTISGTNHGEVECTYDEASLAYQCRSTNAAASGSVPVNSTAVYNLVDEYVEYTIMGADFSDVDMGGMWLTIDGFTDEGYNGTFSIEGDDNTNTLWVSNANPPLVSSSVAGTAGTFTTMAGVGPIPGGYDFLDDGTNTVSISKGDSAAVPGFSVDTVANGDGMVLLTGSHTVRTETEGIFESPFYAPHNIATDGTPVTVGCGEQSENFCGANSSVGLKGFTLSGRTTDAPVAGLLPNAMPAPITQYATFSCSAIGSSYVHLDAGAMAAILGTTPTRIQISGSYVAASIQGDTNVVVGHNRTGWTTPAE